MSSSLLSVIGSIVTIALIVAATRWLTTAKGSALPRTRDGTSLYGIKWQWRAVGITGGAFGLVLPVWSWQDLHRPEWTLIAICITFAILGLWLASGSITTNQVGIAKKGLLHSYFFEWKDITEVRLVKKQGGAIELRSGGRKLVIDSRFNAVQHLLREIEDHTQQQPIGPDTTK